MSKVTIVAEVLFRSGAKEQLLPELTRLVKATRAEEGCIEYRLHQDTANTQRFVFYENWRDRSCLDRHLVSEHFKDYVAATAELVESKNLSIMEELI